MKIAITGGKGLLGRYLVEYLKKIKSNQLIILSRNDTNLKGNNVVKIRKTDYSQSSLIDVLKDVDAVVHLAAIRGKSERFEDYNDNVLITENLYRACEINQISNIVFASSISVYSQLELLPWTENQPPRPYSLYGISKLNCEYLGDYYSDQYDMYIKNLRFAHLFGANEQNDYMINKFIRQAHHKEKLTIFSQSDIKREFLYAKDAARAIVLALEARTIRGTFNIGSQESLSNKEVASIINVVFDNNNNLEFIEKNIGEIHPSYMNSEKAENVFCYKPIYSFSNAMKEINEVMNSV